MKKHKFPGLFIAFEGLDGSGSSSQADLLKKNIKSEGYKVFTTKEPTDNVIGGLIRGVLTHQWKMPADGLQLLYAADRAHHLQFKVVPNLEKGHVMITDRYAFSSIAFGYDVDFDWLDGIYINYLRPDVTFLIKVRPEVCVQRIADTRESFELFEQTEKLKMVWSRYERLAQDKKNKMVIIDGEKSIEEVRDIIWKKAQKLLANKIELAKKES